MSILSLFKCLEAHYSCMVRHDFQHTALVSFNVWYALVSFNLILTSFIIFDLERICCTTMSVLLEWFEWLHVSIHGTTCTEDRGAPKSAGSLAIATFATVVDPALHVGEQIAVARDDVTCRKFVGGLFQNL